MKVHGPTLEDITQREELMNMTATMMFGMQDKTGWDGYGAYMQTIERLQWVNKQALQDILGNTKDNSRDSDQWTGAPRNHESLQVHKLRFTIEAIQDTAVTIICETVWLKERFEKGDDLWVLHSEVEALTTRIEALLRMQAAHSELKALEGPLEDLWIELDALLGTINETEAMLQ